MTHVREILENHEAELLARLKTLRDSIIPLERELADVRRARAAVAAAAQGPEQSRIVFPDEIESDGPPRDNSWQLRLLYSQKNSPSPYQNLTIKDLVRKALTEQFEFGATANELLEFFSHAWARSDIVRTSLSPQLSRLKQQGEIILDGQKWKILAIRNHKSTDDRTKTAADT